MSASSKPSGPEPAIASPATLSNVEAGKGDVTPKAADLPADHYPYRQRLLDTTTMVMTRSLWLLTVVSGAELWSDMAAAFAAGLVAAMAYWVTGAVVKLIDDVEDDEDLDLPAAIRNGRLGPQLIVMAGLTALACATAVIAAQNPVAAVMMVAEVTGCLLAGKIDCWEHAVVMAVMWASGVPALWSAPTLLLRATGLVLAAGLDEALKAWGKQHVDDDLAAGYRRDAPGKTWAEEAWCWVVTLSISRNATYLAMVAVCVASGEWQNLIVLSFFGYEDASMYYTPACHHLGVCAGADEPAAKESRVVEDGTAEPRQEIAGRAGTLDT